MQFFENIFQISNNCYFVFSAWISENDIYNYSEFKAEFEHKNKRRTFKDAIKEIEIDMNLPKEISLKNIAIDPILETFEENVHALKSIYDARANILNRLNEGSDYLTILHRTLTSEQQQKMYTRIRNEFAKDERKYIENPTVSSENCTKYYYQMLYFETNLFYEIV